ncbi:MAG: hydrogenase formation protein HypD [Bacteroidales bacterium]|nr:hydrogenase formation protein HypD [Bacteroidales bacterium]MBN2632660.1 hydrogenase formation protein HypD [Bacteroidales bacterium]
MKYIDEFRDKDLLRKVTGQIERSATGTYTFMEVCGGHTASIRRFGIPSLLPSSIKLISGPGCPVCVTGMEYIDRLAAYSLKPDVIIIVFGDLMRIPGSDGISLRKMKQEGADVRIVFSSLDALDAARKNRNKTIIFAGIGFETTAPGTALTIRQAEKENIDNFLVLSAHKLMPPAMETILRQGNGINGFICPGHVSVITGSDAFCFIPEKYGTGCVITGFEPSDILLSVLLLVEQVNNGIPSVRNAYGRAVTRSGNHIAQKAMLDVFSIRDAEWRGLGIIPASGLVPAGRYERFDASAVMPVVVKPSSETPGCICGEILRGINEPSDCKLFATVCTPENPVGACMVSDEGACNAWYKYGEMYG